MAMRRGRVGAPLVNHTLVIAELAIAIAPEVLRLVLRERMRLKAAMGKALEGRARVSPRDRAQTSDSLAAVLRWWGWIEPLKLRRMEETLLLAHLLDSPEVSAVARIWSDRVGRRVERLVPVGDAPSWTGRAEGLKRFMEGKAVAADPWRLFPDWLREQVPIPPGEATAKMRRLAFLAALQSPPETWVAVRGVAPNAVWKELRDAGLKPWVHRRLTASARLPGDQALDGFESYKKGRLVVQDLSSQAVGLVCDPDPGERWWDVRAQGGRHSAHLGSLMQGKGLVVGTVDNQPARQATAQALRSCPFRNISTRLWDGKHVPGKSSGFDGVLLDAPCSGIGGWRRNPDLRHLIRGDDIARFAAEQRRLLQLVAAGVRPGGTLVYTALTATLPETTAVVEAFLADHPDFRLDPFPHPLQEGSTSGVLQLWPQIHGGDARFIARMARLTTPSPATEKPA